MIGVLEAVGLILALVVATLIISAALWNVGGLIKRILKRK